MIEAIPAQNKPGMRYHLLNKSTARANPGVRQPHREEDMGLMDIMFRSMDIMQDMIARFPLATYAPDVVIEIPRDICSAYEMYRARELIDFGREKAEAVFARR